MSNTILVRFVRKPSDINEVKASLSSNEGRAYSCAIAERIELTAEQYDAFCRLMYKDWDWLQGKGGFIGDVRQTLEVTAPNRETLYVDPSGYSYARYVGKRVDHAESPADESPDVIIAGLLQTLKNSLSALENFRHWNPGTGMPDALAQGIRGAVASAEAYLEAE